MDSFKDLPNKDECCVFQISLALTTFFKYIWPLKIWEETCSNQSD